MDSLGDYITIKGAFEHNLKGLDLKINRGAITVITGVSGSGKSSLAFDTILAEAHRRFFYTLSHYSRQFLDLGSKPAVRSITGLSPAIGLQQNETPPSRRATVGTLTDIAELLGVLFTRFGEEKCPTHLHPTSSRSANEIAKWLTSEIGGKLIAIGGSIAEKKKGAFKNQLRKWSQQGYKIIIDGEVFTIDNLPSLEKEARHSISVIVDQIKVKPQSEARLLRSIALALEVGEGFGEYRLTDGEGRLDFDNVTKFSSKGGCPTCGYSWPRLDPRYFSANSLGQCTFCKGYGELNPNVDDEDDTLGRLDDADRLCTHCKGTGIAAALAAIQIDGHNIHELFTISIQQLSETLRKIDKEPRSASRAFRRLIEELYLQLASINQAGLSYLNLSRRVVSLSGGEAQRLRLAGVLGENLRNIIYVLDEPSQGLHAADMDQIWNGLVKLKELGNTIIIVDHDETIMRRCDFIIDLGPSGGAKGGYLMAKFKPEAAADFAQQSLTATHLAYPEKISFPRPAKLVSDDFIVIKKPRLHNLKMNEVKIPVGAFSVVTGVSGAGKTSLILSILYENIANNLRPQRPPSKNRARYCAAIEGTENFTACHLINRRPIAKSVVSMPATYLDIFTELRNLYASLPEAQIMGLNAQSFSLSSKGGGRCEECRGQGEVSLSMRFLSDARVLCPVCKGRRYQPNILSIKYANRSLADVLELTIEDALEHFTTFKRIKRRLRPAFDLGLGYLKIGQPSSSLSGGEAQRLKLAPLLHKNHDRGTLIIMDEPTTGLHSDDVIRLMGELRKLITQHATVILIEHEPIVVNGADWIIDLGPGCAESGGNLVYQGVPK